MAIRKNEVTGNYYVTYVPFVDRTKRKRYEKAPIVRAHHGLIGAILDWFRGGPNPFLASPIATAVDRKIKLEKQAKAAANPNAAGAFGTQINAALSQYLRRADREADEELDTLDGFMNEEENCLRACRPSEIEVKLEADLGEVLNDVNAELGPAVTEVAKRHISLEHFMAHYGLAKVVHWGKPLTRQSIYLLLGITIFEFVLNTMFFSGSQRSGLIGGAALAMLLSIVTLILGVAFGFAFQFSGSKAEGGGWFGRVAGGVFAIVMVYYLLLLTLARLAGEAGDLHMFETAAEQIQIRPFSGLLDLPALAYFFFSIAVIAGVFYKFIDTMGYFPRIRSHKLAVERAEREVDAIQMGMIETAREHGDEALRALDAAPRLIQATITPIKELVMNYENVADQFGDNLKDVQEGAKLLTGVVAAHINAPEIPLTLDFDSPKKAMAERLARFAEKADELTNWEEVSQSALDRCRKRLAELSTAKLKEIEASCEQVRLTRYREVRSMEAQGFEAPRGGQAVDAALGAAQ